MKMVAELFAMVFPSSPRHHAVKAATAYTAELRTKLEEAVKRVEDKADARDNDNRIIS